MFRAMYVSGVVGCSAIEADALIQRARNAGRDYDKVDWDALQGGDLEYSERVRKLNELLHVETVTKGDLKDIRKQVDWVMDNYEKDQGAWQNEMERAAKDLDAEYVAENRGNAARSG